MKNKLARHLGIDNWIDYYLFKNVFEDYVLWNSEYNINDIKYFINKSKAKEYLSWLRLNY